MRIRFLRYVSVFLICNILLEVLYPTVALALTAGPSQPEVQGFQAVGDTDMVDLFTGDFSYNIPLMDVGGYPINMAYQSGVTMDQESSWVGLGWSLNPGVINRSMRGVPDDFNGDIIKKEFNIKPNITGGVNLGVNPEVFGKQFKIKLGLGVGLSYNNYNGFAMDMTVSPTINVKTGNAGTLTGGLGIKSSSQDGLSVSPNVSFELKTKSKDASDASQFLNGISSLNASTTFNSRSGLKTLSYGGSLFSKVEASRTKDGYISFGADTYVPQIQMPMTNSSITLSAKIGGAFIGIDGMVTIGGYYSSQSLATNSQERPSYGYFNSEKGIANVSALHDYNREKDASYTLNTPRLPVTSYTYDLYSINGQGISGMFRPYRSDVGYVFDPQNSNTNDGYSLGGDFAAGNLAKGGFDFNVSDVNTTTRKWVNSVTASQNFEHKKADSDFEPYYLKQAGDLSVDDDNLFYDNIGKDKAIRPELFQAEKKLNVETRKSFVDENEVSHELIDGVGNNIRRNKRKKRNQSISFLNIGDATHHGLQKKLYFGNDPDDAYNQNNKHHIGEISVLKPDGARYVFGLPAYNIFQKEVSFATGEIGNSPELVANPSTGLVAYGTKDNSIGNTRGLDNYFSKTTLPAYAHSYMLTSVLNADYVDNDNVDGPSPKDAGNYTLFTYEKVNNYQWRVPFEPNSANANQGLKSVKTDDQANYIYGKKELWYVKSMESKNYIAIFNFSNRSDGVGVKDENGGADPSGPQMKKLDNIKLYHKTKDDKYDGAKPIKSVFFKYDYALCPGIPNHKNPSPKVGKLTLREVYFTYQDSEKGRFSPYHFNYCYGKEGDEKFNPSYNGKAYDRWGNYKPIDKDYIQMAENSYTTQSKAEADVYAGVWGLTKISLPSGGSIDVNYEADDYGFIQDKKPGLMVKVAGFSNTVDGTALSSDLYNPLIPDVFSSTKYIAVDLPFAATSTQDFKARYLDGLQDNLLYFRIPVKMTGSIDPFNPGPTFEYVSGYAKINPNDVKLTSDKRAVIRLELVPLKEKSNKQNINPIAFAALQFCRLQTPKYAYGQADASNSGAEQFIKAILTSSFASQIKDMLDGPVRSLMSKGFCEKTDIDGKYSAGGFVRLSHPTQYKIGGGSRVKSISISDNATKFNMGENSNYTQSFNYEKDSGYKDANGNAINISSGVAAYEPMLGGDENPFHVPVNFLTNQQEKYLIPDDRFFMEEPIGESFFPAPVVGYSRVSVTQQFPNQVRRHATGNTVHEFYTANDYPVRVAETRLDAQRRQSPLVMRLLKINKKDFVTASQGYAIHINDMHGKPKAKWIYAEGQSQSISGVQYFYQTDKDNKKKLDNRVTVVYPDGSSKESIVGVDVDLVMDMRQQNTDSESKGLNVNLESFLILFPGLVPLILPSYTKENTRFRSSVATKVVNSFGILDSVTVHDLNSSLTTHNLAYDSESGEVLLTSVHNGFDDPVYSFNYPAHWAYDGMGQAYKNIDFTAKISLDGQGRASLSPSVYNLFSEGDEVIATGSSPSNYKYWVTEKSGSSITIMGGNPATGAITYLEGSNILIKVIRSGRRNLQSTSIGTLVGLENPLPNLKNLSASQKILQAESREFSNVWDDECDCAFEKLSSSDRKNAYFQASKGIWRLRRTYTYLTLRDELTLKGIRKDGPFKMFNSFWIKGNSNWDKNENGWTWVNEVTSYDRQSGMETENKDKLGRYSGALTGFNSTLPTAIVPNTKKTETLFDHFEDYDKLNCVNLEKAFNKNAPELHIDNSRSHSGRKSIKVQPNTIIEMEVSR